VDCPVRCDRDSGCGRDTGCSRRHHGVRARLSRGCPSREEDRVEPAVGAAGSATLQNGACLVPAPRPSRQAPQPARYDNKSDPTTGTGERSHRQTQAGGPHHRHPQSHWQLWSVDHGGVTRLIEADFTASRESDLGDRPPPRVLDVGARDTLRSQPLHLGVEITAHEVQLRPVRLGGMDRDLGRRQAEDQPTFARISEIEAKHLAEKSAIGVGIAAVQDDVCTEDHARILPAVSGRRPEAREALNATARIGGCALPTLMPVAPAEERRSPRGRVGRG
jgi:hypothetical protein